MTLMQQSIDGNATVAVCHTGTRNLSDIIRQADIPVVAMGVPGAITAEMVRGGAVVICDDRCAMI